MSHTPGPWAYGPECCDEAPLPLVVTDGLQLHVVVTDSDHEVEDARLIAAAPDLLAALDNLLDVASGFADDAGTIDEAHPEAFAMAEVAIAKAKGES